MKNKQGFQELRELVADFEQARAGFRNKDIPQVIGFNDKNEKVFGVPRIQEKIRELQNQDPKDELKILGLRIEEEKIMGHYKYITQLAKLITENEHVKSFYPLETPVYWYSRNARLLEIEIEKQRSERLENLTQKKLHDMLIK